MEQKSQINLWKVKLGVVTRGLKIPKVVALHHTVTASLSVFLYGKHPWQHEIKELQEPGQWHPLEKKNKTSNSTQQTRIILVTQ